MPGKKGMPDVPITASLACKNLGIDRHCLRDWKKNKQKILQMKKGAMRARGQSHGKEPNLEFKLHSQFVEARRIGRIISAKWFLNHAKAIYRELYPRRISQDEVTGRFQYDHFSFSNTWFAGFRRRYRIALRCKTKQAQKAPEDYREKIENWLKFNRRNTIKNENSDYGIDRGPNVPTVGRFKLSEIANMDQTPIAFDFLSGRTYDFKGSKTIWIKEQRSGWDRRQATLQVCVYADGIQRCRPLLIFHGDPLGDSRRRAEEKLYDKGVVVAFNKTAWADGVNLRDWVKKQYAVASPYFAREKEPRLLCLDAFAPQMTPSLRKEFKKLNCTTSYIPGGCTGFVQVLDVSLNKPLKALVAQAASDHADKYYEKYKAGGFTVGDRRVLLTQWVAEAWKQLHVQYKDTIIQTFRRVGLSLNPDGSEDHEIRIKGLEKIEVGDFSRKGPELGNGLGSLIASDIKAVEALQAKLATRVAKLDKELINDEVPADDEVDDEDHEEVFTLGRMGTRSQTRVNRYFTNMEIEEENRGDDSDGEDGEDGEDDEGSEAGFDPSDDDDDFNQEIDGDLNMADENMV
jgi:hypothetical protein